MTEPQSVDTKQPGVQGVQNAQTLDTKHPDVQGVQGVQDAPDTCVVCYHEKNELNKMPCSKSCLLCSECLARISVQKISTRALLSCPVCRSNITNFNNIAFVVCSYICKICNTACDWMHRRCIQECPRYSKHGSPFSTNPEIRSFYTNIYFGHRVVCPLVKAYQICGNDIMVVLKKKICISYGSGTMCNDTYLLKSNGSVEYRDDWTNSWVPWTHNPPQWFPKIAPIVQKYILIPNF